MAPAKATLLAALAETTITMPRIPVYSNVTAVPYESPEQIIKAMLVSTGGVRSFVDAGPGKQLKSMMTRIDKAAFRNTVVLDA
jgi:malonyl CoA-acyl carrier protein transacylase